MKFKVPVVLSIAGSDPSGGAGVEADIKTLTSLGVYACSVITTLTVQNTMGVKECIFLDERLIEKQLFSIFSDIDVNVVKIGMPGKENTINVILEFIKNKIVVFDPLIYSKNGKLLFDGDFHKGFSSLIPFSTIITPNYYELKEICGGCSDPVDGGMKLLSRYESLKAILVKGGHYREDSSLILDFLIIRDGNKVEISKFKHRRISSKNLHGTGCTLSSAISAFIAKGYNLKKSVREAINYTQRLIKISRFAQIGRGCGPLIHSLN